MMKHFFLIILFLISIKAYSGEVDPAVASFCENADKISTYAQIYEPTIMTVASPVPPYTGIVYGLVSKTSVLVDFCNLVNDLQSLEGNSKIFRSKQALNDLTGKKWDAHFQQAEDTFNFSQNIYDFENNEQRKGYLESQQGSRDLNDFVKSTQAYVDKNFNGYDADKESSQTQQLEINNLSRLIAKRSIIQEATSCPSLEDKPNYKKIYEKDIQPKEKILTKAEEDIEFFRGKLYELGPKFLDYSQQDAYYADLDKISRAAVSLKVTISKKNEETVKPGKVNPNTGVPKQKKIAIAREVQSYSVNLEETMISNFIEKFSPLWQRWIKVTYLTNTKEYGLFYAQEKIESELRDFSYECRESEIMSGYENYSNYDVLLEKRTKQCKENLVVDEKTSENLLDFYVKKYRDALYKKQSAIASIWTIESSEFGRNRFVSENGKNSAATSYQAENIQCSDTLSAAQLKKLNLEQTNTNAELRESILKNKMKQNVMRQNETKEHQKIMKETLRRKEYTENQSNKTRELMKKSGTSIYKTSGSSLGN